MIIKLFVNANFILIIKAIKVKVVMGE